MPLPTRVSTGRHTYHAPWQQRLGGMRPRMYYNPLYAHGSRLKRAARLLALLIAPLGRQVCWLRFARGPTESGLA